MTDEMKTYTEAEVAAMLEEKTAGLKSKVDELLGESKSAKQKARELEEAQRLMEEKTAQEKGEFKQLWEKTQKEKSELTEKFTDFQRKIQAKDIEAAAMGVAGELTRDTKRAEMIKKEVAQFAEYTDAGIVYKMGGVEVDRAAIVAHISDNYPFLVDGSGATGGGASGSKGGGASIGKVDGSTKERAAYFAKKFQM